jgi:segregation and condensation protein B
MPPSAEPPFDPNQQGISLDELAQAFAQVMGGTPRRTTEQPEALEGAEQAGGKAAAGEAAVAEPTVEALSAAPPAEADSCPISPRSILEAMLFVGNRDGRPLSPERAAELMRDVAVDEIPTLVDELNRRYDASGAPYHIVGEGEGYRLALRPELDTLRSRFYGHIREARLSQAAIDVLALVAYQQPITSEKIGRLRGKPSSHVLAHLVRRGLLRIERPEQSRRTPHYYTTDRFLRLFNLSSLEDLPQSEEAGPP